MALRMAQPWQHPKTGVFWYRRAVPNDLRDLVGKREELASLGTKDLAVARVRYAKVSADVEMRWSNLRAGPQELTEREAHALAVSTHDLWLEVHSDEPSLQCAWQPDLYNTLWTAAPLPEVEAQPGVYGEMPITNIFYDSMRRRCFGEADRLLGLQGLVVDEWSRFKLAKAVGAAFQRASLKLEYAGEGDLELPKTPRVIANDQLTPTLAVTSTQKVRVPDEPVGPSIKILDLLDGWWREAKAAGRRLSTFENYKNSVENFISVCKKNDAQSVTVDDVLAFKDFRLTTPSTRTGRIPSAKTVKDTDLAALKTVFGWAVTNRKLPVNPASGVTVQVGKALKLRSKGFTDEEAKKILYLAHTYVPQTTKERSYTVAAKRWVPWLCAFTGARVGEMGQLRKQDVRLQDGFWTLHITPEAGTVKTNEARDAVIHPQLIKLGFIDFVTSSVDGHLFLSIGPGKDVLGPLQTLNNRLAEFARRVVTDPNVAPNHGWRHRFKTVGMEVGVETRILDAVQGHTGSSVSDRYGEVTIRAQAAAIEKFPWIEIKPLGD